MCVRQFLLHFLLSILGMSPSGLWICFCWMGGGGSFNSIINVSSVNFAP